MFPAARKADPTTHDLVVPSGIIGPPLTGPCPMGAVLIEGLPAAHVRCSAVCSGATGLGPAHPPPVPPAPPPPIMSGSATVHIHGMPAARWAPSGDMAVCGGLLGDPKLIAARTVFIGGSAVGPGGLPVTRAPDGRILVGTAIAIEGDPDFQAKVMDRLAVMASTDAGVKTLEKIEASGKTMTIKEYTGDNSFAGPDGGNFRDATPAGQPVFNGRGEPVRSWWGLGPQETGTGRGSDVTVEFNPELTLPNSQDPANPMPNDAILFHEMEHGAHQMNGTYDGSPVPGWTTQEEQNTISTGSPSEADYLRERGYPWQRADHDLTWVPNP